MKSKTKKKSTIIDIFVVLKLYPNLVYNARYVPGKCYRRHFPGIELGDYRLNSSNFHFCRSGRPCGIILLCVAYKSPF